MKCRDLSNNIAALELFAKAGYDVILSANGVTKLTLASAGATFALRLNKENAAGTGRVMVGSWLRYKKLN